jgi:hypothetical protein
MKTVIMFLISFVLAASATAQNQSQNHTQTPREVVTVDFLYEACGVVGETARGKIPFFDCDSYVYGVLDSYLAIRSQLPRGERACFPASIPPSKVLEDARSLGIEIKEGSKIAGPALIDALQGNIHAHANQCHGIGQSFRRATGSSYRALVV